jgi:putative endonuclease
MTSKTGQKGEDLACEYLKKQDYKIIERNFRCKIGEIDIVAKNKKILIFIEVKSKRSISKNNLWSPELNITNKKKIKLQNLANLYLTEKHYNLEKTLYQIDVIAIELFPDDSHELRHYEIAVFNT